MKATSGHAGNGVRSDARITVEPAAITQIEITSTVQAQYGAAIRSQALATLEAFGNPVVHMTIEDSGALPFALAARLESVLHAFTGRQSPTVSCDRDNPRKERPRRTRLYVPGNSPKFMPNAGLFGADSLIFDLEDSVSPAEKDDALALVRHALAELDFGDAERTVRINSGERGLAEVQALTGVGVDAFVVPKVESAADVQILERHLDSLSSPSFLIVIIESPIGVQRAFDIANASDRIAAMTLGVEDYLASIRASDRAAAEWASAAALNAARAAGVSPLGSVYSDVDDLDGLEAFAKKLAALGLDGMACLHPKQIAPIHMGFRPTDEEHARALAIVQEFEASSSGVVAVSGKMVDAPVYQRAKRVLTLVGGKD